MKGKIINTLLTLIMTVAFMPVIVNAESIKTTQSSTNLVLYHSLKDVKSVGNKHTVILKENGTVWTYGSNTEGQLGDGTIISKARPLKVEQLGNICDVAAGNAYSAALQEDGTIWTWGSNDKGQLGNGKNNNSTIPVNVLGLEHIIAMSAGPEYMVALKDDGTVYTWGSNSCGQLGNGTNTNSNIPIVVSGVSKVKNIAASTGQVAALTENGTVYTWGSNTCGEWDNISIFLNNIPTEVMGLKNVIEIEAYEDNIFILTGDGTVYSLGFAGCNNKAMEIASLADSPGFTNIISKKEEATDILGLKEIHMTSMNNIDSNIPSTSDDYDDSTECLIRGVVDLSNGLAQSTDVQTGATIKFVRKSDGKIVQTTTGINRKEAKFAVKLLPGVWDMTITKKGYVSIEINGYVVTHGMNEFFGAPVNGTATCAKPIKMYVGNTTGNGLAVSLMDLGNASNALRDLAIPIVKWQGDVDDDFKNAPLDCISIQANYGRRRQHLTYDEFCQK